MMKLYQSVLALSMLALSVSVAKAEFPESFYAPDPLTNMFIKELEDQGYSNMQITELRAMGTRTNAGVLCGASTSKFMDQVYAAAARSNIPVPVFVEESSEFGMAQALVLKKNIHDLNQFCEEMRKRVDQP